MTSKTVAQTTKGSAAMTANPFVPAWLRGLDLNQRPLGYEGKFHHHSNRDEPTQTNDDNVLANRFVGAFWAISVAVLHSRFIGFVLAFTVGRACLAILSLARAPCGVDSLWAARVLLGRGVACACLGPIGRIMMRGVGNLFPPANNLGSIRNGIRALVGHLGFSVRGSAVRS